MIEKYQIVFKLLNVRGVGTVQANRILMTIQELYNQSDLNLFETSIANQLTQSQKNDFLSNDNSFRNLELTKNFNIEYFTILDSNYPIDIKRTLSKNAPTIISVIGNINLINQNKVGFCGSRKASEKGLDIAKDCVEQLVEKDLVIVSGYASGIDQQTHITTLKNGGSTIIVLPEGINHFRVKKELKNDWDWNRILVISEFLPNAIWSAGRAMQRNNTIISLSDIMILIESGESGGSMEAGKRTLELNKYLFAPVYDGIPENAKGNQILLNKGAFPLKKSASTLRANLSKIFELLQKSDKYSLL